MPPPTTHDASLRHERDGDRGESETLLMHHGTMPGKDLTDGERQFLIEHGGMTAAELTPEALAETNAFVERAIAAGAAEARATTLTVSEVAQLLNQSDAAILRAVATGDIYSVPGELPSDEPLLPRWQFHEGRVIPHLREVMAALPADFHPLSVQDFMTIGDEDYLDGWPPAVWLLADHDPGAVVQYADDQSWT